jgi:MFS transporter, CP family, cyanate transporter
MREFWVAVGILWLAGVGLRLTILAVPPVIALIQADLHLSGTEIGILSGLPVVLFAMGALPASLLIARLGALATLATGLVVAGIASGLRGAAFGVLALYAATVVMSAGIAVMQPALPLLVRQWLPHRLTFGTAVFTNGLLVGETLPVMLTIPFVLPLTGGWRWGLAVWGLPLVLIALLAVALAPSAKAAAPAAPAAVLSWWPDWGDKLVWQIGILFGSVNSTYFSTNAFLPGHLTAAGRSDLIGAALTALNFGQLPASFALLALAGRLERRAYPIIVSGALIIACLIGIVATASAWTVFFAFGLGFFGAVVFTFALALPPLLGAPGNLARLSGAMFTISYSEALVISVLSGAAWDLGGAARFAFVPIVLAGLPILLVPATIRFRPAAV